MSSRSFGIALLAVLALAGCGANNDTITAVQPVAGTGIELVHVIPDSRALTVMLDGARFGGAIRYADATGYLYTAGGAPHLQAADSTTGTPVVDLTPPVAPSTNTTVFACDSLTQLKTVVLNDDLTPVPAGKTRVRFVALAAGQPAFDFANSSHQVIAGNLGFMQASPWMLLDAGSYDLEADTTGTTGTYASQFGVILSAGQVTTVFVRGPGKSGLPKAPGIVAVTHR